MQLSNEYQIIHQHLSKMSLKPKTSVLITIVVQQWQHDFCIGIDNKSIKFELEIEEHKTTFTKLHVKLVITGKKCKSK